MAGLQAQVDAVQQQSSEGLTDVGAGRAPRIDICFVHAMLPQQAAIQKSVADIAGVIIRGAQPWSHIYTIAMIVAALLAGSGRSVRHAAPTGRGPRSQRRRRALCVRSQAAWVNA